MTNKVPITYRLDVKGRHVWFEPWYYHRLKTRGDHPAAWGFEMLDWVLGNYPRESDEWQAASVARDELIDRGLIEG